MIAFGFSPILCDVTEATNAEAEPPLKAVIR